MNFEFEIRSPVQTKIIEADIDQITRGNIVASNPREAAEKIVSACRPDLDDGFDSLTPDFTVERNRDGSFSVEVDTHGLVDASVELEVVS
jgi:hypothetical protein